MKRVKDILASHPQAGLWSPQQLWTLRKALPGPLRAGRVGHLAPIDRWGVTRPNAGRSQRRGAGAVRASACRSGLGEFVAPAVRSPPGHASDDKVRNSRCVLPRAGLRVGGDPEPSVRSGEHAAIAEAKSSDGRDEEFEINVWIDVAITNRFAEIRLQKRNDVLVRIYGDRVQDRPTRCQFPPGVSKIASVSLERQYVGFNKSM